MNWQTIISTLTSACVDIAFRLLGAGLVFVIGRWLIKLLIKHFPNGTKKHPLDATARNFLENTVKTALYTVVLITVVGILGVPMASVIAVIGSAGAAIALALQGALSNLASGIVLLVIKPMKLGDYIECGDVSGTVSDLGIFYTTLITPDNKHITVPNSVLTTGTIINYSSEKTRRLEIVFQVAHSSDIETVKALIMNTATSHDYVLSDPAPFVRMTKIDSSSLCFTLRVWCLSENYWSLNFDLTEQIKTTLDQNGITVPHNCLDVHIDR